MEIYMSKEELEREKHLFSPHEAAYKLEEKVFLPKEFKEEGAGVDVSQAPPSC